MVGQAEKELNSFADTIEKLVEVTLSEEGQKKTLDKATYLLDVASQIVDHLNNETGSNGKASSEQSSFNGKSLLQTIQLIIHTALERPDSLARHYYEFAASVLQILNRESDIEPDTIDRRFRDGLWHKSTLLQSLMKVYLSWNKHIQTWIEDQEFSAADERRVQFVFNQLTAALSPSNLPINPSALKRAEKTEGQSAVKGLLNWVKDICFNLNMPRQIRGDAYQIGKDLATTAGQVVFRNEQLELIQYQPQTLKVHRRPILLIPPQINKYYIFDLKEKNSILGYLVKQGFQMFVISWRNPNRSNAEWGLDTYVYALFEAIEVIKYITKSRTVGLISACAGGFTASALLGYLAETDNQFVKNHSMLVTALVPNNDSILELFATNGALQFARARSKIDGIMDGKALARVFTWLRPEELVWNYWVNNYLMGRDPPPLDVLYWDNDSTRLPAKLHGDFIDMYDKDVFHRPGQQQILGMPINYGNVQVDTYVIAGSEDYLMPWKGVYKTTQIFRGKHRFALSKSGHVQSVLRPPTLAHTEFYTNENYSQSPEDWYKSAQRHEGSWWLDWVAWLKSNSGALKKAPGQLGNIDFPPLYPAPGQYVQETNQV